MAKMTKGRRRTIILASASKARQRLLREIGLKFRVETARVREMRTARGSTGELVRGNALRKARAVAARHRSGIVIAADTVVRVGKRVVGKPRTRREAVKTLRVLSRRPQWVYTGVAVVDIGRGKTLTGYERTKVFMRPLTEAQARSYLRRVSPLDKAGSFDIQGLGSVFIERVEGCFYNVVGLPLSKLARLLQALGIDLF